MRLRSPLVGEEEKSWSWCNSAKPWIFQVRGKFPVPNPIPLSCKIYDLADAKLMILLSPPPRGRGCAQRHSSKSSRYFIHTPTSVCHHACTPAAGWIANASVQAGEGLSGSAVTCGSLRKEAEAIGAPLAGGSCLRTVQSQPPGRVSRHANRKAGCMMKHRCGPVADMSGSLWPVRVRAGLPKTIPAVCPGRGRSNPDGGNIPGMRGAACRMRTSSGDTRAAREPRHRLHIYSEGKARGRPSGMQVQAHTPAFISAGLRPCVCTPTQLWAKMSVSSQPIRSSLARVGKKLKQASAWASRPSRFSRSVSLSVSAWR